MSVREHISDTIDMQTSPNFRYSHDSVLHSDGVAICYVYTSGFVDDVMFARSGLAEATRNGRVC